MAEVNRYLATFMLPYTGKHKLQQFLPKGGNDDGTIMATMMAAETHN